MAAAAASRTTEHAAHPRRELARRERLGHVVVRAELEADDPVGLLAAGGEHDHGELGARADPAAQLEPVRPRQHHVEHDQVGSSRLDERARIVAVACLERRVPLALEVAHDDLADDRLVVDDENGGHALDRACFRITPG